MSTLTENNTMANENDTVSNENNTVTNENNSVVENNVSQTNESEIVQTNDTTVTNENIDNTFKYSDTDCLDEDPVQELKFVLMSFVTPDNLLECKTSGVKIRGAFRTEIEARAACDILKKKDKYFDIFIGEMGKWLPLNPSTTQVKEEKFRNEKLNKIMNKVHATEIETLNEVVGRKKAEIDNSKEAHKDRIRKQLKANVKDYKDPTTTDIAPEPVSKRPKTNGNAVKARMNEMIKEKERIKANQNQAVIDEGLAAMKKSYDKYKAKQ